MRVLIVDDSKLLRKMLRKAVIQSGLTDSEVVEAGNGEEALAVLEREPIQLVLLDVHMPVMDGETFLRRLREQDDATLSTLPVILVTTEGNQERLKAFHELGIEGYLHKPFAPEQLLELVDEALES